MVSFPSFGNNKRSTKNFQKFSSGLDFSDGRPPTFNVPLTPPPNTLIEKSLGSQRRMNEAEQDRLQGLMRVDSIINVSGEEIDSDEVIKVGIWTRFKAWMVNEGSRRIFIGTMLIVHGMVFAFGFLNLVPAQGFVSFTFEIRMSSQQKHSLDNLTNARATFKITYPIARASALVLHFDAALIMLPVCRNFISLLRRGPLNGVIPFEKNITFHKAVAWSLVFFTVVHILAHMVNFARLAIVASPTTSGQIVAFLAINFTTGPGITGWLMTLLLGIMTFFALEKKRRKHFERFWYSHHLFILFFINWQFHGMFCMIKPDRAPYCSYQQIGVFWKWWIFGGAIYIYERILREVRARHRTYISKVILHPSEVVEIQIKKEKTVERAGQWIYLNVPEVSYWQWHPFTLTSAPEEDFISIHVRVVGDFTTALAESLGCKLPCKTKELDNGAGAAVVFPPINRVLPRVMVDGPFGSASEDVFKYEVSILVGAGIGVTPFASILKSIWYRLNYPQGKKGKLGKVYFFWICRDFDSFEWFQSLLMAIEEQDLDNHIEIHTYLTAKIKEDDINNIVANDVGGDRDTVTHLRAPTHYGRPNWDRIFQSIGEKHPATEAGVFFCGPKVLGSALHKKCNQYTNGEEDGVKFVWGKENF